MDLDFLPPLRDVIRTHDLRAEKSLGQNFLLDQNITDKIANFASNHFDGTETVFEIGPGPGGLTRSLLRLDAHKVIAIEFDQRAVNALLELKKCSGNRLDIIHDDALKKDLTDLSEEPRLIVANLPYNIATPLLVNWISQIRSNNNSYKSMYLMFQREVADRIAAIQGEKAYGRLGVMCQWLCHVRRVYDLPASAFTPPPKVSSAIVELIPKDIPEASPSFSEMEQLVGQAFNQRRKMIRSSLKSYLPRIESSGLNPELRAENLTVQDFLRILEIEM